MAFSAANLSQVMRLKDNRTQWAYVSSDSLATIAGANYFDSAAASLRVGDLLMVSGNLVPTIYVVSANTGSAVTIVGISAAGFQPLDAELTALSGVTSSADTLPYFNNTESADVTPFTAYARTLLDDANAATARGTLLIRDAALNYVLDGGGSTITTGLKPDIVVPFDCAVTGWWLIADQTGSIVIDVWKDSYANYPPTIADTIAGSEKPTLSSAVKNQDTSLSTWTTALTKGDILRFNVDSVTSVTYCTLYLALTR